MQSPTSEYLPPPPAYEVSQQAFDRKTECVVRASLRVPGPRTRVGVGREAPVLPEPEGEEQREEEWEAWAGKVFEEAASRNGREGQGDEREGAAAQVRDEEPSGEESPTALAVKPLRFVKKKKTGSVSETAEEKKRAEARREAFARPSVASASSPSSSSQLPASQSVLYVSNQSGENEVRVHELPPEDDEDMSVPPPPFSAVPPSYEGPRYDSLSPPWAHGSHSQAPSPLSSPGLEPPSSHHRPRSTTPSAPRAHEGQNLSARRPIHPPEPRPSTTYTPGPKVRFDPSTAYSKQAYGNLPLDEPLPHMVNAAALYKSDVAAHLPFSPKPLGQPSAHAPASRHRPSYSTSYAQPQPSHTGSNLLYPSSRPAARNPSPRPYSTFSSSSASSYGTDPYRR